MSFYVQHPDGSLVDTTREPIDLNQSRVQFFLDCKRKYWWQFEQHLVPQGVRWALEDGKAVHEGLAILATEGADVEKAVSVAESTLRESLPRQNLRYEELELRSHVELVTRMIRAYHTEYGSRFDWTPLGNEVSGRVEIGKGTDVFLNFRTDQLVSWHRRMWIIDHKTAAKLDPRDIQKYEMDLQFTAYVYACSAKLGIRVAGVILDLLVKTQTPQFHQQPFVRDEKELAEFEAEFIEIANEIRWRRARVHAGEDPKTVWYKNTKECFRYGTCPYRDLCLADSDTKRLLFNLRDPDYVDAASQRDVDPASGPTDQRHLVPPDLTWHGGAAGTEHQGPRPNDEAPAANSSGTVPAPEPSHTGEGQ